MMASSRQPGAELAAEVCDDVEELDPVSPPAQPDGQQIVYQFGRAVAGLMGFIDLRRRRPRG